MSSETMRAVFWEGKPFHVSVKDTPKPTIEYPDDAIVRLTMAALCGTDLHILHGIFGSTTPPWGLGHEGIGIVTEIGDNVTTVKVGDWVIVPDEPDDGRLDLTIPNAESEAFFGFGPTFGNLGGLQAEFARCPFADKSLIPVSAKLAKEQPLDLVLLSDIWPTAWTCLDFAGFQPGDTVAIFGAGPLGLLCAYSALLRGAAKVFNIDHVPARLHKAKEIGSTPINFRDGDPVKQILALEPNGVTRTCDCVGYECVNDDLQPDEGIIIRRAVELTSTGGGIGVIGVYFAENRSKGTPLAQGKKVDDIRFPVADFWTKGLSMQMGPVNPKILAPTLLGLIESGRAKPGFIFTAVLSIDEAMEGYTAFSEHREVKVAFKFEFEEEEETELANGSAETNGNGHRAKRRRLGRGSGGRSR